MQLLRQEEKIEIDVAEIEAVLISVANTLQVADIWED